MGLSGFQFPPVLVVPARKIYDVLSCGGIVPKYNYIFYIDTIKVISLMQHVKEKLQLKARLLRNVTKAVQKCKYIPVYERGGKCMQSLFKGYNISLTEDEGSIVFTNFYDRTFVFC